MVIQRQLLARTLAVALAALAVGAWPPGARAAAPVTTIKVGFCSSSLTSAVVPFAVATKLGWFAQEGIAVDLVPVPGSGDCVRNVATRELDFSLPSVEPLAIARIEGMRAKIYYTAYQGNIYGLAVPAESPIKKVGDLKGKTIGVTAMSSGGVIVARAEAAAAGLDPEKDITIVVAGEAAKAAALVRSKQVDALSLFDTQYALVDNAGVKVRMLDDQTVARYPSNGFLALEDALKTRRRQAVALARGYAMGTVFALANTEAGVHILYEVYPQTRPTGKDEATAVRDDTKVLLARADKWSLEKWGIKRWGENSEKNYAAYVDFMLKWGIIKQKVEAKDLVTNELIDEINTFDPKAIVAEAKTYKPGG
jgi:NitT/TauT family transport system substrate-binding protein